MRINLLPREERPLKQSEVRWEFIVGLVAVLMLLASIGTSIGASIYLKRLESTHVEAQARRAILQRQVQDVNAIQARIRTYEDQERIYMQLISAEGTSFKDFPRVVAHGFPQLWIERVNWQPERAIITGYTSKKTALSQYMNQLFEYSEYVDLVSVNEVTDSDFHRFRINVEGVGTHGSATDN